MYRKESISDFSFIFLLLRAVVSIFMNSQFLFNRFSYFIETFNPFYSNYM